MLDILVFPHSLRFGYRKGNENLMHRLLLQSSVTFIILMLSLAVKLLTLPTAMARPHHHCGSLFVFSVGETGDPDCLGEVTKRVGLEYPFGNLPTCGDTGISRIISGGGLRGWGVYRIRMVERQPVIRQGIRAFRYQWNFADYTQEWVGYRYCRRNLPEFW